MPRTPWSIKVALFVLYGIAYAIFYIYPNFHAFLEPVYLPMFWPDRAPFLPWTFFIYVSDYLIALSVIVLLHDKDFFQMARMMFTTLILCGAFFTFFPTIYPRPPYPTDQGPLLDWLLSTVAAADMPTNCFPSMHVATTAVAVWCLRNQPRSVFVFFNVWGIGIYLSTLTTKQHYFLDIVGGLVLVACVAVVDQKFFAKLPVPGAVRAWLARR